MDALGVDKNSQEYQALQREIDLTESKLKGLNQEMANFGSVGAQQIALMGEKVQAVVEKMQAVGKTLSTYVTLPLVAIGTKAAKSFAEVDKTMTLTNKTMGNTEEEAKELSNAMKSAASNSTYGMNEAATATLNFARAGLDAKQSAAALAPAMNLATGEGGNLDTVSALHWNDVDNDFICINYSEHRLDFSDRPSQLKIGEPKNGKHRVIQMTNEIKTVFDKISALGYSSPSDYVFTRADGTRCTGHDISCAASRRGRDAGIRGVSIHCIRRTVSSMLNTVLPQKAVADMLGHSERVNEQHYNYSMAENAEKKRALEEVFSKVLKFEEFSAEKKTAINA